MRDRPVSFAIGIGVGVLAVLGCPQNAGAQQRNVYGGSAGHWLEAGAGDHTGGGTTRRPTITIGGSKRQREVPRVYTVRKGDTLWDITGRFFGNPYEWPRVWSYNPEITNPHWIYPQDTVRLKPSEAEPKKLPGKEPGERELKLTERDRQLKQGTVFLRERGYLDRDALEQAGVIGGAAAEQMLLSPYDEIYVEFDNGGDYRPGQEVTAFRRIDTSERFGRQEGILVEILGTIRLQSYDPERGVARGIVTEALDPIERGFKVADVPRRFRRVEPRRNHKNLVAGVVATLEPREMLAQHQLIFLDKGADDGVKAGNRFFIVRADDEWRRSIETTEELMGAAKPGVGELESYPPRIIAEARVVHVTPDTCGAFITGSKREIVVGDRAEMLQGF